jgi:spermidine/putrescine-binding protein
MTPDARLRLQAAMALLDECKRQLRLTTSGDPAVQGVATGEAVLAVIKAHSQIQMVLRDEEERAA